MNAIAPLLSEERADEVGGLWATKQYGDFKVYCTVQRTVSTPSLLERGR